MKKSFLGLVFVGFATSLYAQGSLTPPGAPGATMKTLDQLDAAIAGVSNQVAQIQDEVRVDVLTLSGDGEAAHLITMPGSYYLSGNVIGKSGISIAASNVTLDLNGFEIVGSSSNAMAGIAFAQQARFGISIRNGSISGFQAGIYDTISTGTRLEKITVSGCSGYGFKAAAAVRMIDCVATTNGSYGMITGSGANLSGCTASQNTGYGFSVSDGASLIGCVAHENGGIGIYTGASATLRDCTASHNGGKSGIYVGRGVVLSGCTVYGNQGTYGIYTGSGASLNECTAYQNQVNYGIYVGNGSSLRGCSTYANTGHGSFSCGILANASSSIIGCTSYSNSNTNSPSVSGYGVGIYLSGGSVTDCVVCINKGDGIVTGGNECLIRGNSCYENGALGDGAGIHVAGSGCRIEGNNTFANDRGIDVTSAGNFIARNTAKGNTLNWKVAAGNVCLVVQAATSGAISGNSGGTAPGSTDPNANFTY